MGWTGGWWRGGRALALIAALWTGVSAAGEMDLLLEKLVEKNILTPAEAVQIRSEVSEGVQKQAVAAMSESLSKSITNSKFKGDFRARFQHEETEKTTKTDRDRFRLRLRYGFETEVNPWTRIGFQIASGSAEQTSTNQTFENMFSSKALWIDKAYVSYDHPRVGVTIGKMTNPFYSTDVVWDTDVNPEGLAITSKPKIGKAEMFLTAAAFPLDEISTSSDDPVLAGVQLGVSVPDFWKAKFGVAWYNFLNVKDEAIEDLSPDHQKTTNTLNTVTTTTWAKSGFVDTNGNKVQDPGEPDVWTKTETKRNRFAYDYCVLDVNAQITPFTFRPGAVELPLTLYGNYVYNLASGVPDDTAWLAGVKLGGVKDRGDWELNYSYRVIEKDSVLATLNDSDFHGGGTNAEGHKVSVSYGLHKDTAVNVTYFDTRENTGAKNRNTMLQVDVNTRF